jgi:hypothetical protein
MYSHSTLCTVTALYVQSQHFMYIHSTLCTVTVLYVTLAKAECCLCPVEKPGWRSRYRDWATGWTVWGLNATWDSRRCCSPNFASLVEWEPGVERPGCGADHSPRPGCGADHSPRLSMSRANWYQLIYDIMPKNHRLHNIGMVPTDKCTTCGGRDTLLHRLTECESEPEQWEWLTMRMAAILRQDKNRIPQHWILRPQIAVWPPRRRRAILWMPAHFAAFRARNGDKKLNSDYLLYFHGALQTMYCNPKRMELVGVYLAILTRTSTHTH